MRNDNEAGEALRVPYCENCGDTCSSGESNCPICGAEASYRDDADDPGAVPALTDAEVDHAARELRTAENNGAVMELAAELGAFKEAILDRLDSLQGQIDALATPADVETVEDDTPDPDAKVDIDNPGAAG